MFCSSRQEAAILSEKFNRRGFRTLDLSGEDSQAVRAEAVERLVSDDRGDRLDYLFTVDIFNEGVDIPEINQIIMLRPTQSPIVFVQQLGRGLRKSEGKEFLVVLDFIGNYRNNFMIPVALSGDRSYNKDAIRRYVSSGTRLIPGCSSIHFDEIARERVYESIDRAKTGDVRLLREAYELLRYRVGWSSIFTGRWMPSGYSTAPPSAPIILFCESATGKITTWSFPAMKSQRWSVFPGDSPEESGPTSWKCWGVLLTALRIRWMSLVSE